MNVNYQEALRKLEDLYPGTSDLVEILYWAGRIGTGIADRHIVTYDGHGFAIEDKPDN